ncbi:hypothetical protein ACTXGQ_14165 [Marinobacter sp. 1Y8]
MRQLIALLCLITASLALPAITQAAACDQSKHEWIPTRYYHAGEVVHYNDQWYRSRELHEGREPGQGEFSWEAVSEAPDCETKPDSTVVPAAQADSETPAKGTPPVSGSGTPSMEASKPTADTSCADAPQWVFAKAYEVGTTVRYEGHLYKATRPSNGDMPGVAMPPHWRQLEADCASH